MVPLARRLWRHPGSSRKRAAGPLLFQPGSGLLAAPVFRKDRVTRAPSVDAGEPAQVQAQRRFSVWHQCRALFRLNPRRMASLLVEAYTAWYADGAARLGAALAYYTLFSVAPVLIVVTGVVGLFVGSAAARGEI